MSLQLNSELCGRLPTTAKITFHLWAIFLKSDIKPSSSLQETDQDMCQRSWEKSLQGWSIFSVTKFFNVSIWKCVCSQNSNVFLISMFIWVFTFFKFCKLTHFYYYQFSSRDPWNLRTLLISWNYRTTTLPSYFYQ